MSRGFSRRESKSYVIPEIARDTFKRPLRSSWQQIALNMPGGEAKEEIQRAAEDEYPAKEKVPSTPRGQILITGDRRPAREASFDQLAAAVS